MRAYLLADFGQGPRSAGTMPGMLENADLPLETVIGFWWSRATKRQRAIMDGLAPFGGPWWVVECEGAAHGRRIVAECGHLRPPIYGACDCGQPDGRPGDLTTSHLEGCASYGRILASATPTSAGVIR